LGAIHELHERYGDDVAFYVVYIKEAHPEDGWVLAENREQDIAVSDPTSWVERNDVANACVVRYAIKIPTVIDGPDNALASAYGGWPERLYLIGTDGRVAFQGGVGPFGFKPEELGAAIEGALAGK
jgi:hypothetical protein